MQSPAAQGKSSWIAGHPRLVIGLILVVCLGPFLNKAIHVDDPLFVWTGQWIQQHPADFYGFKVDWWVSTIPMYVANWNPPLMSYFLAGVACLFGWHEIVLHLAGLAVAVAAAMGIYSLARMWCERPLLAAVIAIFTPVFLVSSTTLMCDVLMLALWIWAVVIWECALRGEQRVWQFMVAGLLAGLAMLTKYSAVTLLPLLPILSLLRTRKVGWWLAGLAAPLVMAAGYEWLTARMYGIGGWSGATEYARAYRSVFLGNWMTRDLIGLVFAGGSLLPLMFYAPLAWRRRTWLIGGAVIVGVVLATLNLGSIELMKAAPEVTNHLGYALQAALLATGGVHLLLLAGAEVRQKQDVTSAVLAFWIMSGLVFAITLNWTVSARSFLPLVPAAAILLVRRLRTTAGTFSVRSWWPLLPAAAVALSLALADYRVANATRTAAEQIATTYKPAHHQLWFEGHWGFQYYLEKLGGRPLDCERSRLQPGDIVVVPFNNSNLIPLPPGSVGWVNGVQYLPGSWINLSAGVESDAGGFYSANLGPLPFGIGRIPPHTYCVVKVFSRVQYQTQPANPQEVQAGAGPVFTNLAFVAENQTPFHETPAAIQNVQLAGQFEKAGEVEKAVQFYRKALDADANDPVALNNLAWILATTGKPGLRDGREAVRLATRAVGLTDSRMPVFMGTLAAAYAEAGQFPEAVQMALTAHHLAFITGQSEVASINLKLCGRYAAGRTVNAANGP
ncbi:MAG: glycosyltransferase family 39 protein [Verrucomicrobiota bacterium]